MSLSRLLPGDTHENPLVLDAGGHLVQRDASSADPPSVEDHHDLLVAPARRIIHEGPPSLILQLVHPAERRRAAERAEHERTIRAARLASGPLRGPGDTAAGSRTDDTPNPDVAHERAMTDALGLIDVPTRDVIGRPLSTRERVALARRPAALQHSVTRFGLRVREAPVTTESLYRTEGRPRDYEATQGHHECSICGGVKNHPVSYRCGHSHCYVCIRVWLDKSWKCPDCMTIMRCAPFRQKFEEKTLAAAYPGWGEDSVVDYSWTGLQFPK
ncbi:hypothetical protein B0H13DRAFT_2337909 [Mycena leptocephala]|nr:hypothetical protein B0H13DRAFT_2337909 [Mycena leptocephala]